jgi:hypothetical protein
MITKKPKPRHLFHLVLRSLLNDDGEWDEPKLSMLPKDWEPVLTADGWSMRAQAALAAGYNVLYIPDTILIKIDEHYVADLQLSEKHAQWLLLDDADRGYPWEGDALIVDGSLTPDDFTFEITPRSY